MGFAQKYLGAPDDYHLGPKKPRAPNPGMHFPPGAYIPDYQVYKVTPESAKELYEVQRRLAARGLKSPWLRNEVWRYDKTKWGTEGWRRLNLFTYGWKVYVPMLIATYYYENYYKEQNHGHGGSGHGHDSGHH